MAPLTPGDPDPTDRSPDEDVEGPLETTTAWELLAEDRYEAVTEDGRIVAVRDTASGERYDLEEPAGLGGPGDGLDG